MQNDRAKVKTLNSKSEILNNIKCSKSKIQNISPSPGGRELEGGGKITLTLILSLQGRGILYKKRF